MEFEDQEKKHETFMKEAIRLSMEGMNQGHGGPFGAVVVKDGKIIGTGYNKVLSSNDPTAHAEVEAIREACRHLGSFQLTGCIIYTSCEPCPMCLGAIYWARPDQVFYANNRSDAAAIGFDDDFIYHELAIPLENRKLEMHALSREEALKAFHVWDTLAGKTRY